MALRHNKPVAITGALLLLVLVAWLHNAGHYSTTSSLQWTLSAVVQAMAIMLGLVLGVYMIALDRAERATEYLRRRQGALARKLLSIIPALTRNFLDLESNDPYWQMSLRKLVMLYISIQKILPAGEVSNVGLPQEFSRLAESGGKRVRVQAEHLVMHPDEFCAMLQSMTTLAPLEPLYPERSILNSFRQEYSGQLWRHVQSIRRYRWLCSGPGLVLPIILALTLSAAASALGFTGSAAAEGWLLWVVGAVLALLVVGVVMFLVVITKMLPQAGEFSQPLIDHGLSRTKVEWFRRRKSA